ncbi:uncharacterized protein C8A04DRAFT_37720 [Dichotomopilus funicola]|uniref:Enoyl reductase (ER) domain-containing protein n=1 Tax=Dichotomopilus funicola TaxID=1934379 RepID=A0AAN6ZMC0_9PEZI|nr:hypothetical protein C8A04DRAFT_37720 [Dichotomopilus funicola]
MRSWVSTSFGNPRSALSLLSDIPLPTLPVNANNATPSPTHLLLKVSHVTLNPADLVTIKLLPPWLPFRRSPVPALDFAGEIVAISGGSSSPTPGGGEETKGGAIKEEEGWQVGDRVCGAVGLKDVARGKGSLAEYIVVDTGLVSKVPSLPPTSTSSGKSASGDGSVWEGAGAAGTMGIAGQTAWTMVRKAMGVENGSAVLAALALGKGEKGLEGKRILVSGASGGVGTILLQICRGLGAEAVVGICSGASEELVKKLGAHEIVDYRQHSPLEPHLATTFADSQFDVIFDCVGNQSLYTNSAKYLKPDGKFISIVGGMSQGVVPYVRNKILPLFFGGTSRSYELFLLSAAGETAKEVAALVEAGVITESLIDEEFPMEKAIEAFEKLATKRAKGKIVINVTDN